MNTILTVNAGSTSVRLALYDDVGGSLRRRELVRSDALPGRELEILAGFLDRVQTQVSVVVHRVVHAGSRFRRTSAFDEEVRAEVKRMIPLAPLHNPATLAWEAACRERLGAVPALAAFDSAFFADLPPVASAYALPRNLAQRHGLRRLGFHGLAHRSMIEAFAALRPERCGRVISLQLGGGCSMTALLSGRAIDTSMGFSPLEGLVMTTRPGDLDAGLVLHLMQSEGLDASQMGRILHEASGLAGIAGLSGDARELLASDSPDARLALEVYCYRARKYVGAYMAALGGCDALLIGGGAGEGSPRLRAGILEGLEALGIELCPRENGAARAPTRISTAASQVELWVIPTDEEQVLAAEGWSWLGRAPE